MRIDEENFVNSNACTGCGVCVNVCPKNAITMVENAKGFLYPQIDENLCNNCGQCGNVCFSEVKNKENIQNPKCYAVMGKDQVREKSASGGVFKTLADWFVQNEGYVCGAVYDETFGVKHIVSSNPDDILLMQGSKYVQSDTKLCYREIRTLLDEGKRVLFSGTPCQVSGLKKYLDKSYDNLFCLDIICHGVPSPGVFKRWLKENYDVENLNEFKFREKRYIGWRSGMSKLATTANGAPVENNDYLILFLTDVILRESCHKCNSNNFPRQGDLTIGDFWGMDKYYPEKNDKLGTSLVLVNNEKGTFLKGVLENNCNNIWEVPLEDVKKHNPNLYKSSRKNPNSDLFYENLNKMSLKENADIVLRDKADCMILNFWFSSNYGASLTCFGVKCLMDKLGLNAKVINFVPGEFTERYENSFAKEFAYKYLNLTNPCRNFSDLQRLNENCKIFISGSDQVWSAGITMFHHHNASPALYLLDFVDASAKKLSYAASFGTTSLESWDGNSVNLFNHYIKDFDAVSVRESNGVEILKNNFNIDSTQLIDGAFLIPHETLEEMTKDYYSTEDYIAYFTLPYYPAKIYDDTVNQIAEKLNLPVKSWDFEKQKSVEEMIAFIKNSKFVVTDSFHGIVLSLRFNKPFVQFLSDPNVESRFTSLYELLGIKVSPITRYDVNVDLEKAFIEFDWQNINRKLDDEVRKAEDWMRAAIAQPVKAGKSCSTVNAMIANLQVENERFRLLLKQQELKNKKIESDLRALERKIKLFTGM